MIDLKQFESRFQSFRNFDYQSYPNCFGEFWKWKLSTESKSEHILDAENIKEKYGVLSETLKIWLWHRPFSFSRLSRRLKDALEKIYDAYDQIRSYSLLEFDQVPDGPLKIIWHELGCVKKGEEKNAPGYYLVMPITKPLMILWGQTLAFDSRVRKHMPKFNIPGLRADYWSFGTWKKVMMKFQESLKQQSEAVNLFEKMSKKEYGTKSPVPYGQFLDLYYWVEGKC